MVDHWLILVTAAFAASTIAAIAGTGGGIILLPVLASVFGVREAIPIYTIVQLVGNLSRVGLNRPLIDYRVVAWFVAGAVPFAILGSWLFARLPDSGLFKLLGIFLIGTVILRRVHSTLSSGFRPFWFLVIGGIFSIVSAVVGSAGPFLAPFYLSYGLVKGAFIGTEAFGTAIMHLTKLSTYQSLGVINQTMWIVGLMLGPVMIGGSYLGKKILDRVSIHTFLAVIELAIVGFGVWFIIK